MLSYRQKGGEEMKKRLVVLLTRSDNDRAELLQKTGDKAISFIECDEGIKVSTQPIPDVGKLLCIVYLDEIEENTENIKDVLVACPDFEAVIGTHTRAAPPSAVLVLNSKIGAKNYSVSAFPEFNFVREFCEELAKKVPDRNKIQEDFNKLFELLKS